MKVKLTRPQSYYANNGGIKFGFKGDVIDIDPTFYKLIADYCEIVKNSKDDSKNKDNKASNAGAQKTEEQIKEDLRKQLKDKELELSDKEFNKMSVKELEALLEATK